MRVLAIDTAGPTLGLALIEDGEVVLYRDDTTGLRHTENLLPRIDAIVSEAGWSPRFDGVSVASGPGSFTGLRIGVATAKAIAFASDAPLVFVDTLDALAYSEEVARRNEVGRSYGDNGVASGGPPQSGQGVDAIVPVLDARKGRFYAALFVSSETMGASTKPAATAEKRAEERAATITSATAAARSPGRKKTLQRVFVRQTEDRDIPVEAIKTLLRSTTNVVFPGPDAAFVAEALGYRDDTATRGSGVIGVGLLGYHKMVAGVVANPYDGPFYLREGDIGERKKGPRFSEDHADGV